MKLHIPNVKTWKDRSAGLRFLFVLKYSFTYFMHFCLSIQNIHHNMLSWKNCHLFFFILFIWHFFKTLILILALSIWKLFLSYYYKFIIIHDHIIMWGVICLCIIIHLHNILLPCYARESVVSWKIFWGSNNLKKEKKRFNLV